MTSEDDDDDDDDEAAFARDWKIWPKVSLLPTLGTEVVMEMGRWREKKAETAMSRVDASQPHVLIQLAAHSPDSPD